MGQFNCFQPELCDSYGHRDQFFLTAHDNTDFAEINFLQIFDYTPHCLWIVYGADKLPEKQKSLTRGTHIEEADIAMK
jgi:hypothetical protein